MRNTGMGSEPMAKELYSTDCAVLTDEYIDRQTDR